MLVCYKVLDVSLDRIIELYQCLNKVDGRILRICSCNNAVTAKQYKKETDAEDQR